MAKYPRLKIKREKPEVEEVEVRPEDIVKINNTLIYPSSPALAELRGSAYYLDHTVDWVIIETKAHPAEKAVSAYLLALKKGTLK